MTQPRSTRKIGIMAAVLTMLVLTVSMVAAGNAHFVGTPSISTSGNTATATGKIAGLGNIDDIFVVVTADAQCVNPGSKKPPADNKQAFSADGRFPVQNGKANFNVTLTANLQPSCTGPMTIAWSNLAVLVYDADPALGGTLLLQYP
jgi:hypothetical protein